MEATNPSGRGFKKKEISQAFPTWRRAAPDLFRHYDFPLSTLLITAMHERPAASPQVKSTVNNNNNNNNMSSSSSSVDESEILRTIRESMTSMQEAHNAEAMGDPSRLLPLEQQRRLIRDKLRAHGTDVELNDRDSTGDGDQSPIH